MKNLTPIVHLLTCCVCDGVAEPVLEEDEEAARWAAGRRPDEPRAQSVSSSIFTADHVSRDVMTRLPSVDKSVHQ